MKKLFKINQVARLLNMSPDSIRFYEKKDIVMPIRDTQNDYRGFRQEDIWRLYDCKILQSMGFSISEITSIMTDVCIDDYNEMLKEKWDELELKIDTYQGMLMGIKRVQEAKQVLQKKNVCYIQESPHLYTLCYTKHGVIDFELTKHHFLKTLVKHYHAFPPVAIIPQALAFSEKSLWDNTYGFCIDAQTAERYGITTEKPVLEYKPRRSVYVIIEAKPGLNSRSLKPVYEWMEEHNLQLTGDILGRMIRFNYDYGKDTRVYEVWLPIE